MGEVLDPEMIPTPIWRYKKQTNEKWMQGQIFLDADFDFKIRIVVERSKGGNGYVSFDDYQIKTQVTREDCNTVPADAAINHPTDAPATTTKEPDQITPDCDFSNGMCSWTQVEG